MLVGFPLVRVLVGSARASGTGAGTPFISFSLFADSGHVWTTRRFWFLNVVFHIRGSSEPTVLAPGFNTIPRIGSQRQMSHTSREELDQRQREAPDRVRKIIGVACSSLPYRLMVVSPGIACKGD